MTYIKTALECLAWTVTGVATLVALYLIFALGVYTAGMTWERGRVEGCAQSMVVAGIEPNMAMLICSTGKEQADG